MASPRAPGSGDDLGHVPAAAGNLPATVHSGLIFLEYVNIERKSGGVWNSVASNSPATFETVSIDRRIKLETWTHKPLLCVWLPPEMAVLDGDRIIRSDASHWYVRGAAITSPDRTHIAAFVEAAAEDSLFAARSASEPS